MKEEESLFVYGTLAPGKVNHDVVEHIEGQWQQASIKGTLVELGWGSAMGCPGIYLSADGAEVRGHVLTSVDLSDHWAMLDRFEGKEYHRVTTNVKLDTGENVQAFVYELSDKQHEPG